MPAKNIECQLAQGQIGRYLAGTDMSAEAVAQLELHISECEECSEHVEQKRRTLQEMAKQRRAAVYLPELDPDPQPDPAPPQPAPSQALIEAIRHKLGGSIEPVIEKRREAPPNRAAYWKALAFSGGLGLVLLAMSFVTSNPTAIFGERVEEAASTPSEAAPPKTTAEPSRDPFEAQPASTAPPTTTPQPAPTQAGPAAPPASEAATPTPAKPEATISKPSTPRAPRVQVRARRVRARTNRARPAPSPRRSGIRVYDADGRPITGA